MANFLKYYISLSQDYDVICLQETLLYPNKNFHINEFRSTRLDVTHPSVRGICILSRLSLKTSLADLSAFNHPSIEIIGTEITFKSYTLLIVSVYRHPNCYTPPSILNDILSLHHKYKHLVILGDFNAHHPMWGADRGDTPGNSIARIIENRGIRLLNDDLPTLLHSSYGTFSTVDLAFASPAIAPICESSTLSDPRGNDHFPLSVAILDNVCPLLFFNHKIKLTNKELSLLSSSLASDAVSLQGCISTDLPADYEKFVNIIKMHITSIISRPIGPTSQRIKHRRSAAPWWSETCDETIKTRKSAFDTYKNNITPSNFFSYKKTVAQSRKTLLKQKSLG